MIDNLGGSYGPWFTGWYGIPGGPESRSSKVHVVYHGKPICGTRPGSNMEFQWCSVGIQLDYIECQHCKRIARSLIKVRLTRQLMEVT